ncbi:DUF2442 domain-containing protein [Pleomorphovibrio marinus]|uniref:DUF2442 domain-containing protein n=1 Tax=Pleomorphovibrio marinus TaxID=2164132 RepID=UPI003742E33A
MHSLSSKRLGNISRPTHHFPRTIVKSPLIIHVRFKGDLLMEIDLDNGRSFVVPLEKFPEVKELTKPERNDFEVIDGSYLSF